MNQSYPLELTPEEKRLLKKFRESERTQTPPSKVRIQDLSGSSSGSAKKRRRVPSYLKDTFNSKLTRYLGSHMRETLFYESAYKSTDTLPAQTSVYTASGSPAKVRAASARSPYRSTRQMQADLESLVRVVEDHA
jgi:hypothetical protein